MAAQQLTFRAETPEDRSTVATLIARTYLTQGVEVIEMTGQLRELRVYDPELALVVADSRDEVAGYALFVPVKVGTDDVLLLTTLAIDPLRDDIDYDHMLAEALEKAHDKGWATIIMHGDLDHYKALGFTDAEDKGIKSDLRYPGTILLAHDGTGAAQTLRGTVKYPDCVR